MGFDYQVLPSVFYWYLSCSGLKAHFPCCFFTDVDSINTYRIPIQSQVLAECSGHKAELTVPALEELTY